MPKLATKKNNESVFPSPNVELYKITDKLLVDIRSVQLAQEQIIKTLGSNVGDKAKEFTDFLESSSTKVSGTQKQKKFQVPVERASDFRKLVGDLTIVANSLPLSINALMLILVSKWDAFMGGILNWMYKVHPAIINASGRSILFTDLVSLGDVKAARDQIIADEISTVLRESHIAHFEYIEKKLNISLRTDPALWSQFVELTQRRHLIAHTDGKVSHQYIRVCKDNGVQIDPKVTPGSELNVRPDYFKNSCACLTELGFKLSQVLSRKILPEVTREADANLISTTFDMIAADQYQPAIKILSFSLKPPMKFKDNRDKLLAVVNLAQAYKWSGEPVKCESLLNEEDWSASSLDFLLAVAVLRGDYQNAAGIMRRIGAKGDVTKENYDSWPIFREFRKSPAFVSAYEDVFKTKNETASVPSDVGYLLDRVSGEQKKADKRAGPKKSRRLRERQATPSGR